MLKLYTEILDDQRREIWEKLKQFSNIGYLAGGTGLALQVKHRKSYDFDIFSQKVIGKRLSFKVAEIFGKDKVEIKIDSGDELTFLVQGEVKISFIYFPFKNLFEILPTESIAVANIRDLLANKAYAIGRRGVWRDYVDIYWCVRNKKVGFDEIVGDAKRKFGGLFSEKLFLEQLVYFEGLENRVVEWIDEKMDNGEVEKYLEEMVKNRVLHIAY